MLSKTSVFAESVFDLGSAFFSSPVVLLLLQGFAGAWKLAKGSVIVQTLMPSLFCASVGAIKKMRPRLPPIRIHLTGPTPKRPVSKRPCQLEQREKLRGKTIGTRTRAVDRSSTILRQVASSPNMCEICAARSGVQKAVDARQ